MLWTMQVLALVSACCWQGDPAKDLKSKDYQVRLAAVSTLNEGSHKNATKLLISSLKDSDWEVIEHATIALGQVGGKGSSSALLKLTLTGPTVRIRWIAAESLAQVDANEGYAILEKKISGKTALPAMVAASAFWPSLVGEADLKPFEKALKGKDSKLKSAAASALILLSGDSRAEMLKMVLSLNKAESIATALDAVKQSADFSCMPILLEVLNRDKYSDVVIRRAESTILELLREPDNADKGQAAIFEKLESAHALDSAPLMAHLLGSAVAAGLVNEESAHKELTAMADLRSNSVDVDFRAAAADALGRSSSEAGNSDSALGGALSFMGSGKDSPTAATLIKMLAKDPSPRVRAAAMRSLLRVQNAQNVETAKALIHALQNDSNARVREDAAVALAVKNQPLAAPALLLALQDSDPWVAVVAAVSLGMTGHESSTKPLTDLLKHEDWRMRGAALTGLARSYLKPAVPPIISALEDLDAMVRNTAHQHLQAIAKQQMDPEVEIWTAWWSKVQRSYQLFDPAELERRSEKYGYAGIEDQDTETLFKDQTVTVLESRGDHIEHVLDKLSIRYSKANYGKIAIADLHPRAVFVVNCTGEIDAKDVDRIGWFVRTGGYLLGSCWALHETIERVYPGVIRKFPAGGEVMDSVLASPCSDQEVFLQGVFAESVQPIYTLIGAHLIEVMDPERCSVLVDSAQCAERWGEGNLAVWFPAGHGIILDSVNHFEEQGLGHAPWLKKPEQRQAFAMDHMGMTYAEWRSNHKEKFWSKGARAAREVLDLSVFRLISNFVRKKRISNE